MIAEHLRRRLEAWLLRVWFESPAALSTRDRVLTWLLAPLALPLSALTALVSRRRRRRLIRQRAGDGAVPVIVVGNLVAGGAGKTPLVAALANGLAERGRRPGLLVRGYRGTRREDAARSASLIDARADPVAFGDEAVLLAEVTGLPVAVGRDRSAALELLLTRHPDRDVVIADDGLQHAGLPRRLELLAIDRRGFGNGRCLPAGPLREPLDRVRRVDAAIATGLPEDPLALPSPAARSAAAGAPRRFTSRIAPVRFAVLDGSERWAPADFVARFSGAPLTAVAGIAEPARFFETLRALGLDPRCEALSDHARIDPVWLATLPGRWLILTAKDAVKCRAFPAPLRARCVRLDVAAKPEPALLEWLSDALSR